MDNIADPVLMRTDLEASGIPFDVAIRLGFTPITATEAGQLLGFAVDKAGYAIPYSDPVTGKPMVTPDGRSYVRIKFPNPIIMPEGPAKYLSPRGSGQHAFITREVHRAITEQNAPVILTEGEKKALKATISGIPMIGLPGNFGFSNSATGDLLEELQFYISYCKIWTVVWDSDAAYNFNFALATHRLAACLATRGVKLRELILPPNLEVSHA